MKDSSRATLHACCRELRGVAYSSVNKTFMDVARPLDGRLADGRSIRNGTFMNLDFFRSCWKRLVNLFPKKGVPTSNALRDLIRGVDESSGYARNEARALAKTWLLGHVSNLNHRDIVFAKEQLGYLLPAGWGVLESAPADTR